MQSKPFDEYYGLEPNIISIGPNFYAISFGGSLFNTKTGYLITVEISINGVIAPGMTDLIAKDNISFNEEFYCLETDIINVGEGIFAVAYAGGDDPSAIVGILMTVKINPDGTFPDGPIIEKETFLMAVVLVFG